MSEEIREKAEVKHYRPDPKRFLRGSSCLAGPSSSTGGMASCTPWPLLRGGWGSELIAVRDDLLLSKQYFLGTLHFNELKRSGKGLCHCTGASWLR